MSRPAASAVLCAAVLSLAVTGCGAGDSPSVLAPSSTGSVSPAAAPPASAASSASGSAEPSAPAFPATTGVDTEEPVGGPLSVVAVRVATQDGYDRVVFELDGKDSGEPGWRVEYTDDPAGQGSGDPVQVKGAATLSVVITGSGYPMDTGATEVSDDPTLPAGLESVQDVVLGATFEGQYQAFIGTTREAPFRVFRLSNPTRVVVDIQHG